MKRFLTTLTLALLLSSAGAMATENPNPSSPDMANSSEAMKMDGRPDESPSMKADKAAPAEMKAAPHVDEETKPKKKKRRRARKQKDHDAPQVQAQPAAPAQIPAN